MAGSLSAGCSTGDSTTLPPFHDFFAQANGSLDHIFSLPFLNATQPKMTVYHDVRRFAYQVIIPTILLVGIFGNGLSLLVYSRRRLRKKLSSSEKSSTAGILFLTTSDLLFCIVGASDFVFSKYARAISTHESAAMIVGFYYNAYKGAMINLFLFTSTWMIVVLAFERFIAICYPFHARDIVSLRRTICVNMTVVVVSIVFNLPMFLKQHVVAEQCFDSCNLCYYVHTSSWFKRPSIPETVRYLWFTVGTFIPIFILGFCNLRLILELRKSNQMGLHRTADPVSKARRSLTITLIAMVFAVFLLVCPSMVLECLRPLAMRMETHAFYGYQMAVVVCNILQALKFACNFLLYCCMNRSFRQQLCCCRVCRKQPHMAESSRSSDTYTRSKYEMVDQHSTKMSTLVSDNHF